MLTAVIVIITLLTSTFATQSGEFENSDKIKDEVPVPLVQLGNGYYYFENNLMANWYQALEFCRSHDLHLLSVETEEEHDLIAEYTDSLGFNVSYWTSGSDLGVPGTYIWSSTGTRVTYSNWQPGQPNHAAAPSGEERCIEYSYYDGIFWWSDRSPFIRSYFICERICETCATKKSEDDVIFDSAISPIQPLVQLNGTMYYFENNLMANWYQAQEFCRTHNMQLLSLETPEEGVNIVNYLATLGYTAAHWTSGCDLGVNNTWVWAATGEPFSYLNWDVNQPNHYTPEGSQANCVFLLELTNGAKWHDVNELSMHYIICEEICKPCANPMKLYN